MNLRYPLVMTHLHIAMMRGVLWWITPLRRVRSCHPQTTPIHTYDPQMSRLVATGALFKHRCPSSTDATSAVVLQLKVPEDRNQTQLTGSSYNTRKKDHPSRCAVHCQDHLHAMETPYRDSDACTAGDFQQLMA